MNDVQKPSIWKEYRSHIFLWVLILAVIILALKMGIDEKIVVFTTLVLGLFTQVFAGLGAIIAAIPLVGPFILKVLTIPFFWLLNGLGYLVGALAIKRGYGTEFTKSRLLTLALLTGIVIGYILGHLLPLR